MKIGRKDVFWNYLATFLKIASSVLLLPAILNKMPSEMVGVWTVFITLSFLSSLLDFGFNASFTRNVSYVFSGVRELKVKGYEQVAGGDDVDYDLLKGLIKAMKWFYSRMALIVAVLLFLPGTYYIYNILGTYKGDTTEVYIAWFMLVVVNSYNLYTYYYDALLQGAGYVMRSKQITIAGQMLYLVVAYALILSGYGLIAIVTAQLLSIILVRWLSYKTFFIPQLTTCLKKAVEKSPRSIVKTIMPNAIKIGLTSLGGFLISRSSVVIGGLFLSLEELASFGITIQLIGVVATMSIIYTTTYQAKIVSYRVEGNESEIRKIYARGQYLMLLTFIAGGLAIVLIGPWALDVINSDTVLLPAGLTLLAMLVSLLETNHSNAGNILLTKNEVPFFKASLISGFCIVAGLLIAFYFSDLGIYNLVLVPLVVDVAYQSWKWPVVAHKDLKMTIKDYNIKCLI